MEKTKLSNGRLGRQEYFMEIAKIVAKRSTCTRAQVGAVLVTYDHRIVATGYNGSAIHTPHCIDHGCLMYKGHCVRTIHAEMNAILHLEHRYSELTLYSTHQPCLNCTKALVGANVREIYYIHPYKDKARDMMSDELLYLDMFKVTPHVGKNNVYKK